VLGTVIVPPPAPCAAWCRPRAVVAAQRGRGQPAGEQRRGLVRVGHEGHRARDVGPPVVPRGQAGGRGVQEDAHEDVGRAPASRCAARRGRRRRLLPAGYTNAVPLLRPSGLHAWGSRGQRLRAGLHDAAGQGRAAAGARAARVDRAVALGVLLGLKDTHTPAPPAGSAPGADASRCAALRLSAAARRRGARDGRRDDARRECSAARAGGRRGASAAPLVARSSSGTAGLRGGVQSPRPRSSCVAEAPRKPRVAPACRWAPRAAAGRSGGTGRGAPEQRCCCTGVRRPRARRGGLQARLPEAPRVQDGRELLQGVARERKRRAPPTSCSRGVTATPGRAGRLQGQEVLEPARREAHLAHARHPWKASSTTTLGPGVRPPTRPGRRSGACGSRLEGGRSQPPCGTRLSMRCRACGRRMLDDEGAG